jgi:hypothetical protein
MSLNTREPVVAGRFYPSSPDELNHELSVFFEKAKVKSLSGDLQALIVPHAGYVFSGEVAANGFKQIPRDKEYKSIFLLGSSHYSHFPGASICDYGNYKTPLGEVKVNLKIANKLIDNEKVFNHIPEAHEQEHSLEVQIPFVQHRLKHIPQIIPIVIGTQQLPEIQAIADSLKPYLNNDNLFVISTDFSHYPAYADALEIDHYTAEAICSNDPDRFLETIKQNKQEGVGNLHTSICGWSSVLTLLYMTSENSVSTYHQLIYKNSGDQPYGSKEKVVGYHAIAVNAGKPNTKSSATGFSASEERQKQLIDLARDSIMTFAKTGQKCVINEAILPEEFKIQSGAFVSLFKSKELRGCVGRMLSNDPLFKVVQDMAVSAAFQDHRFTPVTYEEITELTIEISVVSPMQRIYNIKDIQLGKHGIYLKKGNHTGTFLPQVALDMKWDVNHFLGHCSKDKARIGWDGWKDAEIYIYETLSIVQK